MQLLLSAFQNKLRQNWIAPNISNDKNLSKGHIKNYFVLCEA